MIIAGLGNPGFEYESTRHNVGFAAADFLSEKFRTPFDETRHRALLARVSFKGEMHLLVKPQTFMNLSGESLAKLLASEDSTPEKLMVICDDVNLPLGRVRLRPRGSDGGHNGLKSIIREIGEGFWRLRIGVGCPHNSDGPQKNGLTEYVLGKFSESELKVMKSVIGHLSDLAALMFLGREKNAMGNFNGRNFAEKDNDISPDSE